MSLNAVVARRREVGIRANLRTPSGETVSRDLVDVAGYRFEDALPWRELASYKGQRNFVGLWWFSGTNSHVPFESWVERDTVTPGP